MLAESREGLALRRGVGIACTTTALLLPLTGGALRTARRRRLSGACAVLNRAPYRLQRASTGPCPASVAIFPSQNCCDVSQCLQRELGRMRARRSALSARRHPRGELRESLEAHGLRHGRAINLPQPSARRKASASSSSSAIRCIQ